MLATVIQIFEMSSLLVLFSVFYKKTYKKSAQAEAGKEAKTQTFTREEVEARPDLMIVGACACTLSNQMHCVASS